MQASSSSSNTVTVVDVNEEPQVMANDQVATHTTNDEAVMLTALARQLEFYFSPANLSRDTYLQTLQQLNDGHVPISILANFTKIQSICTLTSNREEAVVQAVSQYSPLLQVVTISTVTSKQVHVDEDDGNNDTNTILAVGPRQDAAAAAAVEQQQVLVAPKSPIQNTIILREVQEDVKEQDVRELFQGLVNCPPLQQVRLDVANCWFVTLDTTCRDEMMQVMLDLRNGTLLGQPVKARLKTAATPTNTTVNLDITFPAIHSTNSMDMASAPSSPSRTTSKKKKNNRRKQKKKAAPSSPLPKKKETNKQQASTKEAPPKIQEELHFPALASTTCAVDNIVDKVACVEKGVLKHPSADGASTATTASSATSSTSSPPVVAAGAYAAALLSSKAPPKTESKTTKSGNLGESDHNDNNKKSQGSTTDSKFNGKSVALSETVEEPKEEIAAIPMTWGSGRSFAQVLKKKEQSSC